MRKKNDDLSGRLVMVSPTAFTDPIQRPGQTGRISSISSVDDSVVNVKFEDGQVNAYRMENLVTLAPKSMILDSIIYHQNGLSTSGDLRNMLLVFKLISHRKFEEAIKLAMETNNTRFYCTMDCRNYLDIKQEQRKFLNKGKDRKI